MQWWRVLRSQWVFFAVVVALTVGVVVTVHGVFVRVHAVGEDPCRNQEASSRACWEQYYDDVARERGIQRALYDLRVRYERHSPARTYCHTLLHRIGVIASDVYPSISRAYSVGDTFCRAGYYHGVLEGVFVRDGSTQILKNLDSICTDIEGKERYSYNYFSCVHGIGHGLMAHFSHDVPLSLQACDNLSAEWERSSCYGGVFMENVIADSDESPSAYLSEDPLYPCNAVDEKYRYQCYQMQTSHMLTLFAGDFSKTFAACDGVEEVHRDACYQSLGRDASGWSYGSAESVVTRCSIGESVRAKEGCVFGAAVDFIQSSGAEEAKRVCELAGESGGGRCLKRLRAYIDAL